MTDAERIAQLEATLALRTQTMRDINEALVATQTRAERAEESARRWKRAAHAYRRVVKSIEASLRAIPGSWQMG